MDTEEFERDVAFVKHKICFLDSTTGGRIVKFIEGQSDWLIRQKIIMIANIPIPDCVDV